MIAGNPRSTRRTLLPLLPSGSDGVHTSPLHRARLSISDGSGGMARPSISGAYDLKMAERGGFEPPVHLCGHTHDFQSCSFSRSDIPPSSGLHKSPEPWRGVFQSSLWARVSSVRFIAGSRENRMWISMAERGGFEPPWELLAPKSISSRSRYDHFGTSPQDLMPKRAGMLSSFP